MTKLADFKDRIRGLTQGKGIRSFDDIALQVFNFQVKHNSLYKEYCSLLHINPQEVHEISDIPFLPISFFKSHQIKTGSWDAAYTFESSGTSGVQVSRHLVEDLLWYDEITAIGFKEFYGNPSDYVFHALLPGYLERSTSSLVHMVNHFMNQGGTKWGGFYLHDFDKLKHDLGLSRHEGKKIILIGVSFALLDFAERATGLDLSDIIIIETGGMKGRKKEMIRSELHQILQKSLGASTIHSEYGMTELMSQAYSIEHGLFRPSATMKVLPGSITDPLSLEKYESQSVLRIIDLANIATCSFIATEDMGRVYPDGSFQVLGRLDQSDVRGCNLMYVDP